MAGHADEKVSKQESYADAYSKYYPLVFSAVFSKVNNRDDASDICQEVFLIFYEKYDEILNKRSWLYGTLINVVKRYYTRKADKNLDIDAIFDDVALTFVNGFKDTRIVINEAIENTDLTEEEMLILDYIAFNNYTYKNVGKIMGLSIKQIRYRYMGSVQKILNYLSNKGIHNIEDLL